MIPVCNYGMEPCQRMPKEPMRWHPDTLPPLMVPADTSEGMQSGGQTAENEASLKRAD